MIDTNRYYSPSLVLIGRQLYAYIIGYSTGIWAGQCWYPSPTHIIKGLRFLALPCPRACNLMPKPGPSGTTLRVNVGSPGPCRGLIHQADFDDLTTIRIRKMSSTTFNQKPKKVYLLVLGLGLGLKIKLEYNFIIYYINSKNRKSCITMVEIAKYHVEIAIP